MSKKVVMYSTGPKDFTTDEYVRDAKVLMSLIPFFETQEEAEGTDDQPHTTVRITYEVVDNLDAPAHEHLKDKQDD